MIGSHLIKTWSKTQSNVALSSAESEFYGTLKTAQESVGLISLARELGEELRARVLVDASAALGVAQRLGVGKIRHLQTGALWLQEQKLRKVMALVKVPGSDNRADAMTKNVTREVLERHIDGMKGVFASGRATKAVQIHMLDRTIRQLRWESKNASRRGAESGQYSQSVVAHVNVDEDFINSIADDVESYVQRIENLTEAAIVRGIEECERNFCRQEGASRKKFLSN